MSDLRLKVTYNPDEEYPGRIYFLGKNDVLYIDKDYNIINPSEGIMQININDSRLDEALERYRQWRRDERIHAFMFHITVET